MWRTAASLELLPQQTKTQLGETLLNSVKRGEMLEAATWCLSRLGARKLFSGPVNLVLPPSTVSRWVDSLLRLPHTPSLLEAVVQMSQLTGDSARDLPPSTLDAVRRACEAHARSAELLAQLAGNADEASAGRVFGEDLPAGFVLATANAAP
jgi:hypothetical protein